MLSAAKWCSCSIYHQSCNEQQTARLPNQTLTLLFYRYNHLSSLSKIFTFLHSDEWFLSFQCRYTRSSNTAILIQNKFNKYVSMLCCLTILKLNVWLFITSTSKHQPWHEMITNQPFCSYFCHAAMRREYKWMVVDMQKHGAALPKRWCKICICLWCGQR